jgi:hypothetical protein
MPSYIWSGKDSSGQEQTERVTAATPEEARDILLGRGWTDLQWQTSEVHDFVQQEIAAVSDPNYRPKLTPEQEMAYIRGVAPGFWGNWWKSTRESAGTFLILGFWLAWSVYRHKLWSIIISGGLIVGWAFFFPALHFWFGRAGELFHKLHEARNWRRWNEVLALLESLKRVQKSRKMGIGVAEMARYRALALAGLGKLDEAIDQFTQAAEASNMPRWLYHSHLSSIYTVAERYEQALDSHRQALEETTEKGVVCIDYAACLVQRFNRPAEARQLLAIAEAKPLPELAQGHLSAVRGVIAVREGDFKAANKFMSAALADFEKHAKRRRFIFEPSILLAQGYLALINAALGNKEASQDYFHKSGKYLATIRMDELVGEYRTRTGDSCG